MYEELQDIVFFYALWVHKSSLCPVEVERMGKGEDILT